MFKVIEKNQFIGKKITYPVRAILVGTIMLNRNNNLIITKDYISFWKKELTVVIHLVIACSNMNMM